MRERKGALSRSLLAGVVLATVLSGGGPALAKGPKNSGPVFYIVADRIVGFVPFTVLLYGKIRGTEPGAIELCRTEIAPLADMAETRPAGVGLGPDHSPAGPGAGRVVAPPAPACSSSRITKAPNGYDFAQDVRFDRAGTFQVRLTMVGKDGKRILSNPVQVKAL